MRTTSGSRSRVRAALAALLLTTPLLACRAPEPPEEVQPSVTAPSAEGGGADRGELAAGTAESLAFRCLHRLPVAACEAAGVAAFDRHLVVSVAVSATAREYCGGDQPTAGLRSGFLVLDRSSGAPLLDAPIPLEGGFGGAEADGAEHLWQSVYSEGVIVRARIAPEDPGGSGVVATVPIPERGRIGGVAFDGRFLWGHNADEDRLYVIDPGSGAVERTLEPPHGRAVNGLAWAGGRLYAALNDDASGPSSTGAGEVPEAIIRLDPASGREVARWPLPAGLYPHSMDAGGAASLVVLVQRGLDPRLPAELWELALPADGGSGVGTLQVEPCEG